MENSFFSDIKKEPDDVSTESEEQIRAFLAENFENNASGQSNNEFKPFAKDPAKQKRYEQYLVCVKNGRGKIALPILQPKNMPGWFTIFLKILSS